MAQIANLKFVAEICMWVRIPPPVPSSPSRPASLIEERVDFFFRTRFVGSTAFCRCPIMIYGSPLPVPSRRLNRHMRLSLSHISPPPVSFSRTDTSENSIRFAAPHHYSAWLGAMSPPPPRAPFPMGGEARIPFLYPLSYPPNRLLAHLLASLSVGRLGVFRFPIRPAGRMCIFRARIRFPCRFRRVL